MHIESGLYANFGAGYMKDDGLNTDPGFQAGAIPDDRSSFYAFEVGIEKKWHELLRSSEIAGLKPGDSCSRPSSFM